MDYIQRVYAVRRGILKAGTDTTHYALIIKTVNGQRIKILETRNALKIRKEVKFNSLCSDPLLVKIVTRSKKVPGDGR